MSFPVPPQIMTCVRHHENAIRAAEKEGKRCAVVVRNPGSEASHFLYDGTQADVAEELKRMLADSPDRMSEISRRIASQPPSKVPVIVIRGEVMDDTRFRVSGLSVLMAPR